MDSKVVSFANERLNLQTDSVVGTKLGNSNINVTAPLSDFGGGSVSGGSKLTWNISGLGGTNTLEADVHLLATVSIVYTRATDFVTNYATILGVARNRVGLHGCPLNRLIPNCDVTINGQERFSSSPAEEIDFYIHAMNESELRKLSDIARPDNSFDYNTTTLTDVLRAQADSYFSSRGLGCTRITSVTANAGATTLTIVYELREKLMASPFQGHKNNPQSFIRIDNMQVSCLLASDLSLATAAAGSSTSGVISAVSTISNVRLELRQSTPHAGYNIPSVALWMTPSFVYTDSANITNAAAGSAGLIGSTTSTSVCTRHFSTVPKMFCIYAYETRPSVNSPFRFFPISSLSLRVGGSANIFGNYTKEELYEISKRYGLNSLPSCMGGFYGGTGLTTADIGNGFMFYFSAYDFDTPELFQSNAMRSFDVTIESITLQNYDTSAHTVRVRLMAMTDKLVKYENGQWSSSTVGITDEQLVNANSNHQFIDADYSSENLLGGSLWSWIRDKVIKPVIRYGREHNVLSNVASELNPTLGKIVKVGESAVSPYLKSKGYGHVGGNIIETGGKKLTQAQLLKALRD